jgi:hypothetical protein
VVANRCPSSFQWEALVPTLQRLASGCQSLWSPGDFYKRGDVFIEANSKEIQEKDIITRKKSVFSPPIVENILT